jgi:hypothetical protein
MGCAIHELRARGACLLEPLEFIGKALRSSGCSLPRRLAKNSANPVKES